MTARARRSKVRLVAPPPAITLYIQPGFELPGRARCFSGTPFAIKVKHVLDYEQLAYTVHEVGWLERAELLPKISASKKLPVLAYDGALIEDSTEIAYLLDARHPEPPLIPGDPLLAARCHFLEEWADEVLYWYGVYEQRRINSEDEVAGTNPWFEGEVAARPALGRWLDRVAACSRASTAGVE